MLCCVLGVYVFMLLSLACSLLVALLREADAAQRAEALRPHCGKAELCMYVYIYIYRERERNHIMCVYIHMVVCGFPVSSHALPEFHDGISLEFRRNFAGISHRPHGQLRLAARLAPPGLVDGGALGVHVLSWTHMYV